MHKNMLKIAGILTVPLLLISINSFTQDTNTSPVRIVFDNNSERIDIATGKQLTNYTHAQRGSFQFYDKRLDSPTDHINYMFSTMRNANVKDIVLPPFIWSSETDALSK